MENIDDDTYKSTYRIGLGFIGISFLVYLFTSMEETNSGIFNFAFFLNYGVSLCYLAIMLIAKLRQSSPRPSIPYACWINAAILFTISAFALNKGMYIFAKFPIWLNIYTLLSLPLFLLFPYYENMPNKLKAFVFLLTGFSLVLSFYMVLYLAPIIPISILGLIVIGISIHAFVPFFWLLILFKFLLSTTEKTKLKLWILPGMIIPLLLLGIYLQKWHSLQVEIKDLIAEQNLQSGHKLPKAIYLAQKLPSDVLTEEILIAPVKSQRFWDEGNMIDNNSGVHKYHNPLATIAMGAFDRLDIDGKSVEAILNIRKDARHITTRKLWTGQSLKTSAVSNNIEVFPDYRLAYHEKIIVIHNDKDQADENSWFVSRTQEALYTFHVPEGTIVTSLSLWINGREEKSRLSALHKADSAYRQIVGVENRDPAIVHWQEGNRVTVTIFPCTTEQDREFKIGFTTPLRVGKNKLYLENIWFEGPDCKNAREATQILIPAGSNIELPKEFEMAANGNCTYKGDYLPYWKAELENKALSKNTFSFGGYMYSLEEDKINSVTKTFETIFLDVSNAWTKPEYNQIVDALSAKTIYAWLPEKTKITKENRDLAWEYLYRNQFSVPFVYDINSPGNSVILTKTSYRSPVLADLKESELSEKFTSYLSQKQNKINVINIGNELSPFWRSLRELRLVNYEAAALDEAVAKVQKGQMNINSEDSSKVVLNDSKLIIRKIKIQDSLQGGKAPDHLLRIFAYNDILRRIGGSYFEKEKYEDDLFREAEEAYVVSPITAMIVLESEKDYQRMGIDKNKNTVGNAGIKGDGAVPEPQEWLLIALVATIILRYLYKKRFVSAS